MTFSIYTIISKTLYSQGLNGVFCKMFGKVMPGYIFEKTYFISTRLAILKKKSNLF